MVSTMALTNMHSDSRSNPSVLSNTPQVVCIVECLIICTTTFLEKAPDIVLWSQILQSATLVELTISYKTNYIQVQTRKSNKYQDLVDAGEAMAAA